MGSEPPALWRSRARRPGSLSHLSFSLSRGSGLSPPSPGVGSSHLAMQAGPWRVIGGGGGGGKRPTQESPLLDLPVLSLGGSRWVTLTGGRLGVENTGQGVFAACAILARLWPAQGVSSPAKYRTRGAGAYGGVPAQDCVPWLLPSPASRVICRDGR